MLDPKVDLSDRVHTFEALGSKSSNPYTCTLDSNVPDVIHIGLSDAIRQIKDHLSTACKIELKNATFYFKFDKNDKLYLKYAAGI